MNVFRNFPKLALIISLVVFGLFFIIKPFPAQAATVTELQAKIKQLQAQITQLQQQLTEIRAKTEKPKRVEVWHHKFETNLRYETKGLDVKALHTALEKEGFKISESEQASSYFGRSTVSAVTEFQEKYKEDILGPWGLEHGTGYVGKTTRKKLNEIFAEKRERKEKPKRVAEVPSSEMFIVEEEQPDFQGYIIQFKEKPLMTKWTELQQKKEERLLSSASAGSQFKSYEKNLNSKFSSHKSSLRELISDFDQKIRREFKDAFNGISLNISKDKLTQIEKISFVKEVYPNYKVEAVLEDSVPLINADQVWDLGYTGQDTTIAIIDTGIDYTHSDLGGCFGEGCKVKGGYDFVNNDDDPMDDMGHGTHCAGIAAGDGALTGVAPDADLLAYKVLNSGGTGSHDHVIAGIERAVDPNQDGDYSDHADVISLSLGGSGNPDDPQSQAIDTAVESGVVAVISAGNSGPSLHTIGSPGTARRAITVGASCKPKDVGSNPYCQEDRIASFSSRGNVWWWKNTSNGSQMRILTKPDVIAPGVSICAAQWDDAFSSHGDPNCNNDDNHVAISGTSMAAPHVSGLAALILQNHPDWSPRKVKNNILANSEDRDFQKRVQGHGEINCLSSIEANSNEVFFRVTEIKVNEFPENADGVVEPGESINLSITILNGGKPSSGVSGVLSSSNDNVEIEDKIKDYKDFNSYEEKSRSFPVNIKGLATGQTITFLFNASSDEYSSKLYFDLPISIPVKKGWPQEFDDPSVWAWDTKSPSVADLNQDGKREIITADRKNLYVWDLNGNYLPGWPAAGYQFFNSPPAIGNLDQDQYKEVVMSGEIETENSDKIYVFEHTGEVKEGWPKKYQNSINSIPVLKDLNNDGKDEILFTRTHIKEVDAWLHIITSDGQELPGWPKELGHNMYSSPAVGDINGDNIPEIISLYMNENRNPGLVAFTHDGTEIWRKQLGEHQVHASPLIGDFDKDGEKEILMSVRGHDNCSLYLLNSSGQIEEGWPAEYRPNYMSNCVMKNPSVGDIDEDSDLEVILGTFYPESQFYAFEMNGDQMPNWSVEDLAGPASAVASFSISDVTGDSSPEILIARTIPYHGDLTFLNEEGDYVGGYKFGGPSLATPLPDDVDNDGKVEVIYRTTVAIYVLDLDKKYSPSKTYFQRVRINNKNTGCFRCKKKPDLFIYRSMEVNSSQAKFMIGNIGDASATDFVTTVELGEITKECFQDSSKCGTINYKQQCRYSMTDIFKPKDQRTYDCKYQDETKPGTYYAVRMRTDIGQDVEESNEDNNQRVETFQVSPQNDPVTGTLSVSPTTTQVGQDITLTIEAQDDEGIGRIYAYYHGEWHQKFLGGPLDDIPTSTTTSWTFSESSPGTYEYSGYVYGYREDLSKGSEGSYTEPKTVSVTVTSEQVCTDSDGGKDYYTKGNCVDGDKCPQGECYDYCFNGLNEFYCSDGTCGVEVYDCPQGCQDGVCVGEKKPDLFIYRSMEVNSSQAKFMIGNIGSGDAGPFVTKLEVDGTEQCTKFEDSLNAGQQETYSCEYDLAPGDHTVTMTVDFANEVEESDEDNNTRQKSITVGRTPPCGSYGDVNDDGYVTSEDATLVSNNVGNEAWEDWKKERADVDGDGEVEFADSVNINDYAKGEIDTFEVCGEKGGVSPTTLKNMKSQLASIESAISQLMERVRKLLKE